MSIKVSYFDFYDVEHIPLERQNLIGHSNVSSNIYKIQLSADTLVLPSLSLYL